MFAATKRAGLSCRRTTTAASVAAAAASTVLQQLITVPVLPPPTAAVGGSIRSSSVRSFSSKQGAEPEAKKKQPKVKKKKKSSSANSGQGETGGRNKQLDLILASLDAPMKVEGDIPDEEKQRRYEIGRNYVIGRFRQHNEIDHDLTCKLHMKRHAINMLPKRTKLREEALKIEMEPTPPLWRRMPVWTPPIPGFDPKKFVEKDDD